MKLSGSNISKDLISNSPYYLPNNSCDVNMKAIFAVMNTIWAVVEIRPEKKLRPVRDLNPLLRK